MVPVEWMNLMSGLAAGLSRVTAAPLLNGTGEEGRVLVQLIALVKPFRAKAVLAALESVEILGGTVREAMGYNRQKNRLDHYLGSEYNASFLPKVEITLFLTEAAVPDALRAIVGEARTGAMGDGKIILVPCRDEYVNW